MLYLVLNSSKDRYLPVFLRRSCTKYTPRSLQVFQYSRTSIIRTSIIRTIRLSGLFSLVPIFSLIWISCDLENSKSRKKPNNPFKRLLKQRIILCAFQNSDKCDETKRYSDAFSWYLIGSIVLLPREFHAWLVPSVWVMWNTRAIDRKLKSKTCLRSESEPFYRLKISR